MGRLTRSTRAISDSLLFTVCMTGPSQPHQLTHDQGPLIGRLLETHSSPPISGCLHAPLHIQRSSGFFVIGFSLCICQWGGFIAFKMRVASGWPNYLLSREATSDRARPTVLLVIVSGGLGVDIRCCTALRHP